MRRFKIAVSFVLCASLVRTPRAGAAVACAEALSPAQILRESFQLDLNSKRDQRIQKKIDKINFANAFSENDIARLVKKIRIKTYGAETSLLQLVPGWQFSSPDFLLQLIEEEAAREGLVGFFKRRQALAQTDRLMTKLARLRQSDIFVMATWLVSLSGLRAGVPIFQLPEFQMLKPTSAELATLVAQGTDSPEGQEILRIWLPRISSEHRRVIFVRALNTLALVAGISTIMWLQKKERDAKARANGDKVKVRLDDQMNHLDQEVDRLTTDTQDDILYDAMIEKQKELKGSVSTEDYAGICKVTAAPHRCH